MTGDAPGETGDMKRAGQARTAELFDSLGASDWSLRREAVLDLAAQAQSDSIQKLLQVVREQHRDLARLNAALQVLARAAADVVPELVQLLSHPDHEVRAYTALALGERGDPRAIAPLVQALSDADSNVRMHAVEALGKLRAGAAVDALLKLVESPDFELAFPAVDALIAIGDERIAHRLLPLLQNPLFKEVAVEALAALGDEEAVAPLLGLLGDPDVPPFAVATALVRIQQRYSRRYGDDHTIADAVRALAGPAHMQALIAAAAQMPAAGASGAPLVLSWLPGPAADEALVHWLDRFPADDEAVAALAHRGPPILPLLLNRMAGASDEACQALVECIARIGDRAAVPALLQLLAGADEEDLLLRLFDALARQGDPRAYEPLRAFFGHPSGRIRQAAVAAVNSVAHPKSATDLLAGLHDGSPLVRESNLRVAAYLGSPEGLESVLACCGDTDERVRRAAVESLPTFDDPRVVERLTQAIQSDTPAVRAAAVGALAKLEDASAAADALAGALRDDDVWVRYFAVRSLVAIKKHAEQAAVLEQLATSDPAMQVQLAAIEALGQCGPRAIPVLLDLLCAVESDVVRSALGALGGISHPEAQDNLAEALHSPRLERRLAAIAALARTKTRAAAEPLRACARGMDDRTAAEAITALCQLGHSEAAAALIDAASLPARREKCVVALAAMSDAAVPALAQGLRHGELDTRRAIVEALARIRSAAAVDALEIALADREPAVRHAALSALAHLRRVPRTEASAHL